MGTGGSINQFIGMGYWIIPIWQTPSTVLSELFYNSEVINKMEFCGLSGCTYERLFGGLGRTYRPTPGIGTTTLFYIDWQDHGHSRSRIRWGAATGGCVDFAPIRCGKMRQFWNSRCQCEW
jgi:hypothetical protein